MKYILTILWSFLLSAMMIYVLSSMSGEAFNLNGVYALTVVFSIVALLVDSIIKDKPETAN